MKQLLLKAKKCIAAAALIFAINIASAQTTMDTVKTAKPNDPMVVNPGKANDANVMMTDTGFIRKNIADNIMEIQLAKAGRDRGTTPQVKRAATLMITDHTAILNDLRQLASKKSATTTEMQMGRMSTMPAAPDVTIPDGSDFNKAWASQMLTMHEEKIRELEDFIAVTQDQEIKAAANKALPKIKTHRDLLARIPGVKADASANTVIQ